MILAWNTEAFEDLKRLHAFLASSNPTVAGKTVRILKDTAQKLKEMPRIGERLEQFEHREVRRIIIERYEIRYEVQSNAVYILRIWHTRENR